MMEEPVEYQQKPIESSVTDVAYLPRVNDAVQMAKMIEASIAKWNKDPSKTFYDLFSMYYVVLAFSHTEIERAKFAYWFWTFLSCKAHSMPLVQFNATMWPLTMAVLTYITNLFKPLPIVGNEANILYPAVIWSPVDARGKPIAKTNSSDPDRFFPPSVIMKIYTGDNWKLPWTEDQYTFFLKNIPCSSASVTIPPERGGDTIIYPADSPEVTPIPSTPASIVAKSAAEEANKGESWWEKYSTYVLVGGVSVGGLLVWRWFNKSMGKRRPLPRRRRS